MILCCGEALIDMLPVTGPGGEDAFAPHVGGAVFNTAITLGRLGAPAGMVTGLSRDMFGMQLADALAHSHVDTDHVVRSDLPTTLAFVRLRDGHATYTFYDENTAGRSLTPDAMPELPDRVRGLFFGGISLCSEPGADAYLALAERENASRVVMLDPNIRPGFIQDEPRYRARLAKMIAVADVVKVSADDLDWLFPDGAPEMEKAARLRREGAGVVLLTRGGEGAVALTAAAPVEVPAVRADVVDTVAAGDTFNGAFLARLDQLDMLEKDDIGRLDATVLADALGYAARAAAITVSRSGANPPWADEMKAAG